MSQIDAGHIRGASNCIALTEVLVQPMKANRLDIARQYEEILTSSLNFRLDPVTVQAARQAAYLRAKYALRTPDALHIASALEHGCDAFLTNDLGLKRVDELRVLILDEVL